MRAQVSPWLLLGPVVVTAAALSACFEVGVIDVVPSGDGGGGASSTSTSGAAGMGGMGGVSSSTSTTSGGGMSSSTSTSSTSTSTSGASTSSSTSSSSGAMLSCPVIADTPTMVLVQAPAGGPFYCVDSTEVTNAQYLAWLATTPDPMQQIAECASWNTSFAPAMNPVANALPIANVDWCDAYTFCEKNGKRLCGRVGGGAVGWMENPADATVSEWLNVCSTGGTKVFPYGDTYGASTCNGKDQDPGADKAVAVMSSVGCVGGFPGVYDMSGNVWEWENSCDGTLGAMDTCRRRGGGYSSIMQDLDCTTAAGQSRNTTNGATGFRCCADAQ